MLSTYLRTLMISPSWSAWKRTWNSRRERLPFSTWPTDKRQKPGLSHRWRPCQLWWQFHEPKSRGLQTQRTQHTGTLESWQCRWWRRLLGCCLWTCCTRTGQLVNPSQVRVKVKSETRLNTKRLCPANKIRRDPSTILAYFSAFLTQSLSKSGDKKWFIPSMAPGKRAP